MDEENKVKCSAYGDNPQECELYPDCDDCGGNITKLDMTQEEKELLIKDLCSRLPYECIVSVAEGGIDGIQWTDATLNSYLLHQIMEEDAWEYVKPYLRPMSSMTEEEKEELRDTYDWLYNEYPFDDEDEDEEDVFLRNVEDVGGHYESSTETYDFYNRKMFDYRGLIPKDLALEAKEGMYNN